MWLNLAAAASQPGARSERDLIAKKMTRAQITEAIRRAGEWEPKAALSGSAKPPSGQMTTISRHKEGRKADLRAAVGPCFGPTPENHQGHMDRYFDGLSGGNWSRAPRNRLQLV
jgi:hypothetical protein